MNYFFPKIRTIDDVLPAIKGRDEFIVAEKDGYTVINYVVALPDTFDMKNSDDLYGAMRRECRGLIFGPDDKIMSRPFHKFFNIGEREETQYRNIDMTYRDHWIVEKEDGSMIRPILVNDELRLATKMGVTDVSRQAEDWMKTQSPELCSFMHTCMCDNFTPIFEWVSPENRIVVRYSDSNLVLLALRENVSGKYHNPNLLNQISLFDKPKIYASSSVDDLESYVAKCRSDENREGFILIFDDGHMVKGKNDWYLRIHKAKEKITQERNIMSIFLNEELDDLLPMLDEEDRERINTLEQEFWTSFLAKKIKLNSMIGEAKKSDKKTFALKVMPTLEFKEDAKFIFKALDGIISDDTLRDHMLKHCMQSVSNTTKYDRLKNWLGMT